MIRAGLFAFAALTLASVTLPRNDDVSVHRDTREALDDVNLAAAVADAQKQAGTVGDGLPTTWCGDQRANDDTRYPGEGARFKVVYAYAADRQNRFGEWADALQANVAIAQRFLSAQSGGRKALRFDMGTSCGPLYVDVQVVALPGPRSSYADNFNAIAGAVRDATASAPAPRNTIVLADSLSGQSVEYGLGETIMGASGQQAGAANPHNRGRLSAVLFSRDGGPPPGPGARGWWPEGFLHEITHNLGAVQWAAPHSTQPAGGSSPSYGHCWQGADVMCYAEDAGAAHPLVTDCAPFAGMITQSFDCGRDDYFNPAPDAGSYLATHWNTYDSAFLAACAEIAPACGGGELWTPAPPAATDGPAISGQPRRGAAVSVSTGAWINRPTSFRYQWQRLTRQGWRDIREATAARYRPAAADLGRRLRATVVAGNRDGEAGATSAQTAPTAAVALNRSESARSKARRSTNRREKRG